MALRVVLSLKSGIVAQLTVPGSRSKASRATEYLGRTDSAPQWTQDRAHPKAGPVAATLVGDVLVGPEQRHADRTFAVDPVGDALEIVIESAKAEVISKRHAGIDRAVAAEREKASVEGDPAARALVSRLPVEIVMPRTDLPILWNAFESLAGEAHPLPLGSR